MKPVLKTWSTPVITEKRAATPCPLCGSSVFKPFFDCGGFSFVKCASCSLVQQNPRPSQKDVINRYNENDYLNYELQNEEVFLRLSLLALKDAGFFKIEKKLFASGKNRVLDVGCASGALLQSLKKRGWETRGIEISEAQASYASGRGVNVVSVPLEEAGFAPGGFDVVIASHLIEHLNDPDSFVRTVYNLLDGGGYFFITTPAVDGLQARIFGPSWRSAIFDHLYLFSKRTLFFVLKKCGFIIERRSSWGGLPAGFSVSEALGAPFSLALKKAADRAAKTLNIGDVMIVRARKK
ncbi:MAG: class I SAM-dependent methyltransferase [Spirochaetaceae bacterium]|jgi:2-polyprenyl-3-methyl-5-hydroxy-6-metoxy-1,4-benzoquinol methylase|nr:class I SAM-dependent methyltransferase [Spirochaetaceae bacterium]